MAGITTEERIRRRMVYCGVPERIAVDMLTAESGGDCVLIVNGKRIMPNYWHEGRVD